MDWLLDGSGACGIVDFFVSATQIAFCFGVFHFLVVIHGVRQDAHGGFVHFAFPDLLDKMAHLVAGAFVKTEFCHTFFPLARFFAVGGGCWLLCVFVLGLINFVIDVAKLAHCIAEAQRQFGDSLQLTQIQRDSTDFF